MAPIRSYNNWNTRTSNNEEQVEPYKRYYFICEGQNTERWYFEKFIDLKKEFNVSSLISIEYLEKTGKHETWSNPKALLKLANSIRKNNDIIFDAKRDVMIVVFDADIYEGQEASKYNEIVKKGIQNNVLCVTNPSFELFLLLHYENSYNEVITPNYSEIIKNDWVEIDGEKIRYIEFLFRDKTKLKPKKDKQVGELAKNVRVAIEQEKNLNSDIFKCRGKLTSNVGTVIQTILDDGSNS